MAKILLIGFLLLLLSAVFRRKESHSRLTEEGIRDAIVRGEKIKAIKGYRALHRCDFGSAKKAVETLEEALRREGFIQ